MNRLKLPGLALLAALTVTPFLSGCFPVVAGGAAAGTLILIDRRTSDTYVTDEAIELRAANRISERFGKKVHVNVTSYNRTALLTGEVPDAATRSELNQLMTDIPNLRATINETQVAGISSFSARANDTWLTTQIKGRFVDANRFGPQHVKVVSEAGTAYLLGLVTQREAEAATDIARHTKGVLRVVTAFEIISEADAQRLDQQYSDTQQKKQ